MKAIRSSLEARIQATGKGGVLPFWSSLSPVLAGSCGSCRVCRKRKQEAAHELVQRQERLSRENHELLELLQGREAQIVELRRRIAAAESRTPNAWSPPASSDPTSDPISDPIDLYWQF